MRWFFVSIFFSFLFFPFFLGGLVDCGDNCWGGGSEGIEVAVTRTTITMPGTYSTTISKLFLLGFFAFPFNWNGD